MAVGDIIKNKFYSYTDPVTGTKITRLTEPDHISHHMYFYNKMVTPDDKGLLYAAEIDGERQLYMMDLETGDAKVLTEGDHIDDYGGILSEDGKYFFFQQNMDFIRMDLESGKQECYYTVPDGWRGSSPGPSHDGKYMSIVETKEDTIAVKNGIGWNFFRENCLAKPHCRIVYIDVCNHTSNIVLEDRCWIGHTQIRPHDPDTIMFCHEGPYDVIDARIWLVNKDGSNLRCGRKQPEDTIITHEYWFPGGEKFAFVYKDMKEGNNETIRTVDPDTLEEEIIMECSAYAHFISNGDNSYMIGDAQGHDVPIHLLEERDREDNGEIKNDFIYLIDPRDKKEIKICYHGTSWKGTYPNPQDAHPHPFFTNSSKSVIFVSDKDGLPCLYRAELNI